MYPGSGMTTRLQLLTLPQLRLLNRVVVMLCGAVLAAGLPACEREAADANSTSRHPATTGGATKTEAGSASAAPNSASSSASSSTKAGASQITLIAGGDVSLGRLRGQRLLRNPQHDDFASMSALMTPVDLRFVNLECPLSEQGGETQSPGNKLVFTGPPIGADALARAHIDIVSLANNHGWDYGRDGLMQTLANLERTKIAYVGAGRSREQAYGHRLVEHDGFVIAFVAVTAIWNQNFSPHPGKELIADADLDGLVAAVKAARAVKGVDKVIVSHHGGYEYIDRPHQGTRKMLRAAVAAGADVVLGHHPHVVQTVGLLDGKPIFYSLGNMLMRMVTGKPWTEFGIMARLTLRRDGPTEVSICPFRIFGLELIALGNDPQRRLYEAHFRVKFERLLSIGSVVKPDEAAVLGPFGADGCASIKAKAEGP